MNHFINLTRPVLIVGLGITGFACARYLHQHGVRVTVTDSRPNPPVLADLCRELPDIPVHLGAFDANCFAAAEQIVLSPGVSPAEPLIIAAKQRGIPVIGDIELFAQRAQAPIAAITGSNGKSTVTTLLGEMAKHGGRRVAVGGNLGTAAVALLDPTVELYVLELSSFQLETTASLQPQVATVLNLSPDHQDRHADFAAYIAAKQRVFNHAHIAIINRDDPAAAALAKTVNEQRSFGLNPPPNKHDWGVITIDNGQQWLIGNGELLMPVNQLRIAGRHNVANALAAAAMASALGLSPSAIAIALTTFSGLPHRCELVAEYNGVRFINDSKGTNPGATVAALAGLIDNTAAARAILIAGGDGKGADFTPLITACRDYVRAVVLIGRDAPMIQQTLNDVVPVYSAGELEPAIQLAAELACAGDCVLLSPACASFDQFRNYQHRGEVFRDLVQRFSAAY
ncbi:UDP-N-acetylmuramoyl-L-alanine--D-glutamate ligase [Thiospirillum jenense]|uniref:UDP-N-acetylmuramoylalanine--D-glutamate ligase n=1 Tax=Thiospirillum jenense TaxID=1653858 RepID=A0A839HAS5_9GAMM|nr:UDP-N-acetylmuramoyl-L-alanine--D-glutamate ligase [Thiospirillum jenense]MBB1126165.1 UDP-N-acetylmuramoyl-L-alanine--D-glutamate ligase [Thiospirillum jenense]